MFTHMKHIMDRHTKNSIFSYVTFHSHAEYWDEHGSKHFNAKSKWIPVWHKSSSAAIATTADRIQPIPNEPISANAATAAGHIHIQSFHTDGYIC